MFPTSLHFIKTSSGSVLGSYNKDTKIFGFVNPKHAHVVKQNLSSDNVNVKEIRGNKYVIAKKQLMPLNKDLTVDSLSTEIGLYFAQVNNLNVALIDDVCIKKNCIELLSNFSLGDIQFLNNEALTNQFQRIYEEEEIDYVNSYANIIMNMIALNEDADESSNEEE